MPGPPAKAGFPVAATLAPVVVSVAMWAITQSIYALLFAFLGPVVAVAGLVDGRIQRRRAARRDTARLAEALDAVEHRLTAAQRAERERLGRLAPARSAGELWTDDPASLPVDVGRAELDGRLELSGDGEPPAELRVRIETLRARAETLSDAPLVVDAADGLGIVGPDSAARALARAVVVQLAARCSPAVWALEGPETWIAALPHVTGPAEGGYRLRREEREVLVAWAAEAAQLPLGCGVVVRVGGAVPAALERHPEPRRADHYRPRLLGRAQAHLAATVLRAAAETRGVQAAGGALPERVELAALLGAESRPDSPGGVAREPRGLAAPIGVDTAGAVLLDLVVDGPHALVAGTTGSGKSELLVAWVLAMAARHPPSEVTFLLVDFKGGAAFAPLTGLPHVVATLSDLDRRLTRRAIESLRAELLGRERTLAAHGARSIEELTPGLLARLVIVVDEFAAVVADAPELHEVFADLAARGRSLGLHLVLCTQRPSGVVRDAVLANVNLRMSLRVTDRGDSQAMIGSDAAARLPSAPRGRLVLADGRGLRTLQLAIASPTDAQRIRQAAARDAPGRPWCEPLPRRIPFELLPRAEHGLAFGLVDLPAEQRQPVAAHDPARHGHLLVLGASGSGKTNALATLAASAREGGRVLSADPAELWAELGSALEVSTPDASIVRGSATGSASDSSPGREGGPDPARLLLLDDADLVLGRADPDTRAELLELLARVARESAVLGIGLVISAQRLTGPLHALSGLFGSRLLLRMPSREEHVLAGGEGAAFDPELPSGAATWRGAVVQLALAPTPLPPPRPPAIPFVELRRGTTTAVASTRVRELTSRLVAAGVRVVRVGDEGGSSGSGSSGGVSGSPGPGGPDDGVRVARGAPPEVLLGDPDAWSGEWSLLGRVRRELPFVLDRCTPADHRALVRSRETPPPLRPGSDEVWRITEGETARARWALERFAEPGSPSPGADDEGRRD